MREVKFTRSDFHMTGPEVEETSDLVRFIFATKLLFPWGILPPLRVLNTLLSDGSSGGGMSPSCEWESFEISEDEYWELVEKLEAMGKEEILDLDEDLEVGTIRVDYAEPKSGSYMHWIRELKHRFDVD